jgi:hypothetical protein
VHIDAASIIRSNDENGGQATTSNTLKLNYWLDNISAWSRISYGRKASNEEISRLKRRISELEGPDHPLQISEPRETGKGEDHNVHPDLSGGKETLHDV